MVDQSALLAHIVSQTRANIDFLATHNQISQSDARDIISKLPGANDASVMALADRTQTLMLAPTSPPPAPRVAPSSRQGVRARAIWGWNENAQDANDLSFRAGDEFEIISETNPDWWTGRHNGKQGLFPSNYVEKTPAQSSPYNEKPPLERNYSTSPQYNPQYPPPGAPPASYGGQQGYQSPPPFNQQPVSYGGPQGYQSPPPPNQQPAAYNPYMAQPPGNVGPPPQQQQQVQQPATPSDPPPKKSRFGGLGNTLAQSAAGGLGFGAGSAVGGDLINKIF
ncbi:SH3-domain-containing protein [Athelia psychrophila]|uniref:SH3-domain-containing protein n=1 Tax=Athelia psychrophila TaxID=1759441 RepID=A0A166QPU8_9AGAM|nr:SH3-domain-containing protein [Fibularhizoctonia sp. CBS 109695]